MTELIHVTRLPPSPSGVALYAHDLDAAYALLGEVEDFLMPPEPQASQSLLLAVKIWWRLRRIVRRRSATVVSVELAGRGIAEMWAAWALTRDGRRVWVTIHDVPSVCGPSLLTHSLDRRGGRRLGLALSRSVGRRAERDLLRRADVVMTLSRSGARALSDAYRLDRTVIHLPHVMLDRRGTPGEPRILVPGYVGGVESLVPLVRLLPSLPHGWRLVVGAASNAVHDEVLRIARELDVADSVDLLGFLDEDALDHEFVRASIVVRWRVEGWLRGPADYAVSGPLIRALGRGCAIVTNDRRGAVDCLNAAGAIMVSDGRKGESEMTEAVSRLVHDHHLRATSAEAGLAHIALEHSPTAIASRLAEVM